jgi:hypothetical protein
MADSLYFQFTIAQGDRERGKEARKGKQGSQSVVSSQKSNEKMPG